MQWELARLVTGGLNYDNFPISHLAELRKCNTIEEGVELVHKLFDPSVDENKSKDSGPGRWHKVFEQETAAKVRVCFTSLQTSKVWVASSLLCRHLGKSSSAKLA